MKCYSGQLMTKYFTISLHNHNFWVRFGNRYGIKFYDMQETLPFSLRYGHVKYYKIGNWAVEFFDKPMNTIENKEQK